ncbi:MAG: RDD family protein [Streptosporangiaceae bacterium]|nr:RDD family protein [Streptosporangiaceae bacterium]
MDELVSGEAVVIEVPCARFPSRLAAILIDFGVQGVLLLIVNTVIVAASGHLNAASVAAIALTASVLVIVGYPTIFETLGRGRSLGKLAFGLRVIGDDGSPERFRQALVRALAAVVEIWMLTGAPALITSLISARGKRLGDLFAGTYVIQERLPARTTPPPQMPPHLAGWAASLELSALPDSVASSARSYLSRYWELTPQARHDLGQRVAADVASRVSPPPPPGTPPADFLAAVLAERRARALGKPPE